jgi:hypothetical protein
MSLFLALCRAVDEKIAMKKQGIPIGDAIFKDGKIKPLDKAPKHVKIARKKKAKRSVDAWKAAQHPRGK